MFEDDIQNRGKIHYIHCTVYIVSSGNTGVDLKALDHLVQRMDRLAALLCPIRPRFLRAHCLEGGGRGGGGGIAGKQYGITQFYRASAVAGGREGKQTTG
jgi:hypothetical protein